MLMDTRLKIIPAIQWYEGMMLAPHHFQQQELRAYQLSSIKFKLMNPFCYGFLNLTIDKLALAKGTFSVSEIEGILPDGEIITVANNLQIPLGEYKTHRPTDFTVWIGMQPWDPAVSPINKESPRYQVVEGDSVPANEDPSNLLPISRLVPIVSLYIATEEKPSLVSMPVAKILCEDNIFSLMKYTPPCFTLNDAPIILDEIKQCAVLCRKKESYLLQKYEAVLGTKQESWVSHVLNTIRQTIPLLEMLAHNSVMHPFEVYKILCQTVGVLAGLKHLDVTTNIPAYQHNHMHYALSILLGDIREEINAITANYRCIPFDLTENVFSLFIDTPADTLLLSVTFKDNKSIRGDWVSNTIIVSDSEIDLAIKERIIGAKRRVLKTSEYPTDLYDTGDLLIEVAIDDRYIFNNRKLILFNPINDIIPENIAWCIKE